jgi:hypothetical protein
MLRKGFEVIKIVLFEMGATSWGPRGRDLSASILSKKALPV